jgi:acetate kinase
VNVLCLNRGSSSLKFACIAIDPQSEHRLSSGTIERLDTGEPAGWVDDGTGRRVLPGLDRRDPSSGVSAIFQTLRKARLHVHAVGHRIVFGGVRHTTPEIVTSSVLDDLRSLGRFAPEHLPAALETLDAAMRSASAIPHVVCFDTAFHQRMPDVASRLPLSQEWYERGVRRYGFHGLSYEYIVSVLGESLRGRVVIAHLGHGASMAAIRDGVAVDTTMGLTPTGGLVMSTRTGDLDPGVMLHLARAAEGDLNAVERLVTHESGLAAVSGVTGDMQQLLAMRSGNRNAARAIEMFCYSARKHLAAMSATLGGLDTLVFTGGIGEHASAIRAEICEPLGYLGISLDPSKNERHDSVINASATPCTVRVIPTDENIVIARHTYRLTGGQ